ncbi:MAG: 4Fe-4S binding protein [Thauera propionica]|uniref:4Fe-4S binding protein n=1 Tax=Thauera propionica TaxID=2019431 RepID=A0A235EWZ7_9RHOO|nr:MULTISPECIES: NosR/NirI family protein [Thauera]MDD3674716.1 4Fe-4S binding protein [Thauera propionica]MDI3489903.1 NosR/NirI family transcriptional regulator, nitrous oxide reductase regulator [Thauera sp.]MDY0046492.1 4Fe-4S binding protein [Thauera propionica]OYD53568.1 4Fe-4S binding protein [Thauera propionica]
MKPLSALRGIAMAAILATVSLLSPPAAAQTAYEAKLPPEVNTAPALCDYVPCTDVLPGATSFSERKGQPPYVEGYAEENGQRKLIGYVVLSTDVTDTPAYSGKPVVTLIGLTPQGHFAGIKILKHSEPILLLGIPESALTKFNDQYLGQFVGANIEIGRSRPEEDMIGLDAISGATVTVIAQNQVMMMSGAAVGRQVGILEATVRPQANFADRGRKLDWATLVKEGAVQRLTVMPEQVGLPRSSEPFIDLWYGYLNHPEVGRAIMGETGWRDLMARIKEGEHALFVIRTGGNESFKGSGFVRGGIYDRVQLRQGQDVFTFRDLDYYNLYGVSAPGAPSFNESAIFIVRSPAFSGAFPWKFIFLGNRIDRETGARTFVNFDREYWLPSAYLEGGRPVVKKPDAPWVRVWKTRAVEIGLFAALLIAVAAVYANRDALTRRSTRKNKWPVNAFKYSAWIISIGFVGFGLLAQPSITQVLTWFHSLLFQWQWELFLTDPFIFLFWIFIILTVFVWGRGLFCGWLCPFGSLSELLYKVGRAIGLKRFQFALPMKWHNRLKWVKYAVFFGLLAVSMFSMGLAEKLAEVEPFKTTFLVGLFNRSWPYTLFAAGLLGLSIFMERPFCKYLCPLGAALAMPSTFRWFGLRRKQECDSCKACAVGCGSLAIDEKGRIDHRECMLCLDCMVLYTDEHACPPLAQERKRRTKAGLALTPIGKDGYYIPIKPVAPAAPRA